MDAANKCDQQVPSSSADTPHVDDDEFLYGLEFEQSQQMDESLDDELPDLPVDDVDIDVPPPPSILHNLSNVHEQVS
jgi:hypothetical protein